MGIWSFWRGTSRSASVQFFLAMEYYGISLGSSRNGESIALNDFFAQLENYFEFYKASFKHDEALRASNQAEGLKGSGRGLRDGSCSSNSKAMMLVQTVMVGHDCIGKKGAARDRSNGCGAGTVRAMQTEYSIVAWGPNKATDKEAVGASASGRLAMFSSEKAGCSSLVDTLTPESRRLGPAAERITWGDEKTEVIQRPGCIPRRMCAGVEHASTVLRRSPRTRAASRSAGFSCPAHRKFGRLLAFTLNAASSPTHSTMDEAAPASYAVSMLVALAGAIIYILLKAYRARKIVNDLRKQGFVLLDPPPDGIEH